MAQAHWFRPIAGTAVLAAGLFAVLRPEAGTAQIATVQPGQVLAAQCSQCHGPDGRSVSGIEGIAGEGASELYDELIDMKYGSDSGIMDLQARGYTDDQLRLIADYLGSTGGDAAAQAEATTAEANP